MEGIIGVAVVFGTIFGIIAIREYIGRRADDARESRGHHRRHDNHLDDLQ